MCMYFVFPSTWSGVVRHERKRSLLPAARLSDLRLQAGRIDSFARVLFLSSRSCRAKYNNDWTGGRYRWKEEGRDKRKKKLNISGEKKNGKEEEERGRG